MIFSAKNEDGVPTWKLVKDGSKVVTRRLKPLWVDDDFAIQSGRGRTAICRARVVSCIPHYKWLQRNVLIGVEDCDVKRILKDEATKEGFNSWAGLMNYFEEKKINMFHLYRIEFQLIF